MHVSDDIGVYEENKSEGKKLENETSRPQEEKKQTGRRRRRF